MYTSTLNNLICVAHQLVDENASPQDIHDLLEEIAMRVDSNQPVDLRLMYPGVREIVESHPVN